MDSLIAVSGFVTVAAITPGPNNFIVMAAAARGGMRAAMPAAAGVLAGSLCLLLIVWAGAGAAFGAAPNLRSLLTVAGALYLGWLGCRLAWGERAHAAGAVRPAAPGLPRTGLGVAGFQFLNPKGWVLVLTATALVSAEPAGLYALVALFIIVPALCLSLWAFAGSAIAERLKYPKARVWFDRTMGALLIVSAALLFA